jgi:hypothetical protein
MVEETYGFFMKWGGAGVYIPARAARRRASAWVGAPGRGRTHAWHARTRSRTRAPGAIARTHARMSARKPDANDYQMQLW